MVAPMLTTDAEMLPSDLEKVIAKLSTDAETSLSEKIFKNEFFMLSILDLILSNCKGISKLLQVSSHPFFIEFFNFFK